MPVHESLVKVVCQDIYCDRVRPVQKSMISWVGATVDGLKTESDCSGLQRVVVDCVANRSDHRGNYGKMYFGDIDDNDD